MSLSPSSSPHPPNSHPRFHPNSHLTPSPSPQILALSGPSSSGKTTLANVLAALLSRRSKYGAVVVHLDDFYRPEAELPRHPKPGTGTEPGMEPGTATDSKSENGKGNGDCEGDGWLDWDSAESFDLERLRRVCERWKEDGRLDGREGEGGEAEAGRIGEEEEGKERKKKEEGEGERYAAPTPAATEGDGIHTGTLPSHGTPARTRLESIISRLLLDGQPSSSLPSLLPPLLILDGILLHTPAFSALHALFDIRILLRASFAEARQRRHARGGYVTLESFWEDPEGYFEEVVWRSYCQGHGHLFVGGDVEGMELGVFADEDRARGKEQGGKVGKKIWIQPLGMDLAEGLEWVWGILEREFGSEEGGGDG